MRNLFLLIITLSFLSIDSVWAKDNEHEAFLKRIVKEQKAQNKSKVDIPQVEGASVEKTEYIYKKKCFTVKVYVELGEAFENSLKEKVQNNQFALEIGKVLAGRMFEMLKEGLVFGQATSLEKQHPGFLEHIVNAEASLLVEMLCPDWEINVSSEWTTEQLHAFMNADKDLLSDQMIFSSMNKFLPAPITKNLSLTKYEMDNEGQFYVNYECKDINLSDDDKEIGLAVVLKFFHEGASTFANNVIKRDKDIIIRYTEKQTGQSVNEILSKSAIINIVNTKDSLADEDISLYAKVLLIQKDMPKMKNEVETLTDIYYNLEDKTLYQVFEIKPIEDDKESVKYTSLMRLSHKPELQKFYIKNDALGILDNNDNIKASAFIFYVANKEKGDRDSISLIIDRNYIKKTQHMSAYETDSVLFHIRMELSRYYGVDTAYFEGNNVVREYWNNNYASYRNKIIARNTKNDILRFKEQDLLIPEIRQLHKNYIVRFRKPNGKDYVDIFFTNKEL